MKILLTNDDGINATGLHAMRRALLEVPGVELAVIAPDSNRSATARSITTRTPLWVDEIELDDGTTGYATDGTPVDCVRFAALGLIEFKPELIVSGINHGVQPRRRHHLLGHGCGRAGGDRAGHPGDRGVPAGRDRPGGLPRRAGAGRPRTSSRPRASSRGWSRSSTTCRCPRHPPERELPRRRGPRAPAPASSASASIATAWSWPRRKRAAGATASTARSPATTRRTARTSPRSPTARSPSPRCTST